MGKKEVRMNQLIELVSSRGYISIKDAAAYLHVSEMTIRRDLNTVESSGLIKNVTGVLVFNTGHSAQALQKAYELLDETNVQNEVKSLIGRFAASLIEPGDCVIFDVGTTTEQIVQQIPPHLDFQALCFSRNIMMQLSSMPQVKVALAGGYYHPDTQAFISPEGVDFIHNIRANKFFLSAAGIHRDLGISCANNYEVPAKRACLSSANQRILVADSSKFGVVRSAYYCNLSDIDAVITDYGLSGDWADYLREHGITLYQV